MDRRKAMGERSDAEAEAMHEFARVLFGAGRYKDPDSADWARMWDALKVFYDYAETHE